MADGLSNLASALIVSHSLSLSLKQADVQLIVAHDHTDAVARHGLIDPSGKAVVGVVAVIEPAIQNAVHLVLDEVLSLVADGVKVFGSKAGYRALRAVLLADNEQTSVTSIETINAAHIAFIALRVVDEYSCTLSLIHI